MKLTLAFLIDSVEFTAPVIAGTASLGGSESACLGLARALQARGHEVHIFTTQLGKDAPRTDHAGVSWHAMHELPGVSIWREWDVMVGLRMPHLLTIAPAKFKVLWNQDLMMAGDMQHGVMSNAWAFDACAYVSAYHRHQWEGIVPELAAIGYVTRNGFDPALVPTDVTKNPNQIIHISRPERGLGPLLSMWPALREVEPDAELALCRYSSMYDKDGWGQVCADFDRAVTQINDAVGGIRYLGELGKPGLYQAIAESAVMWYPGVASFAETSCVAAIEAQANGTPFVGSYKGALPETCPGGVFVKGDATSPEYQTESIQAVRYALTGARQQTFGYRQAVKQGREHVAAYTYAAIAAEWEGWLLGQFEARYATQKIGVLRRLLHEDDHVTADVVAAEILAETPDHAEAADARARCARVIAGQDHTAEDYGAHASDPIGDLESGGARQTAVVDGMAGATRVLDVACGPGTFALALAQADPTRTVVGIDFSEANVTAGRAAAEQLGLSDRVTFHCAPVWDMDTQAPSAWWQGFAAEQGRAFDGVWCGEFIEHVANCTGLVEAVESVATDGAVVMWSCPFGPMEELIPRQSPLLRGHVHHFQPTDLTALFGHKDAFTGNAAIWDGTTPRGALCGNWLIRYLARADRPTGERDLSRRTLKRPYSAITAGIISNDTTDIRRCLESVWDVVDEIVIGDCGADPADLARLVAEFPRKTRVVPVGAVRDLPGGFSEARNTVLAAATGEWFFWIDCDEILCGGDALQKYLDGPVFNGYVICQNHLHLDLPKSKDTPVRVFRRRLDIQFYGCIHEQPQMGDCNGEIIPALQVDDVQIAHTGYLHEGIRRQKALMRNLPLLLQDQKQFPDRELGKLLVLRDYANLAVWEREKAHGRLSLEVKEYQRHVIALFEARFMDSTHRYHHLARPYYESALRDVAGAFEVEIGAAIGMQGLGDQRARAERVWVRTPEQLRALLAQRIDVLMAPIEHPTVLDVEPLPQGEPVTAGAA